MGGWVLFVFWGGFCWVGASSSVLWRFSLSGLACAVEANQAVDFALGDGQVGSVYRNIVSIALGQTAEL